MSGKKRGLLAMAFLSGLSANVFGAEMRKASNDAYRTTNITARLLNFDRQMSANWEWNLQANASVALEGSYIPKGEDLTNREVDESRGDSLTSSGREFSLLFSRYSNPNMMSGFYWTLGAGYRTMTAQWVRHPEDGENLMGLSLTESGKVNQEFRASGMTGHGRLGYKFVGDSVPIVCSFFVGLRHFQATVEEIQDNNAVQPSDDPEIRKERDAVRANLKERWMTSPELGIDIGYSF